MKLATILSHLGACTDARVWAKTQPDLETAWRECKRSDWMLWLLAWTTLSQDDSRLRLMACDFAEAALIYVPAGEDRPRQAIEVGRDVRLERRTLDRRNDGAGSGVAAAL